MRLLLVEDSHRLRTSARRGVLHLPFVLSDYPISLYTLTCLVQANQSVPQALLYRRASAYPAAARPTGTLLKLDFL
jgi:hypothetical protein